MNENHQLQHLSVRLNGLGFLSHFSPAIFCSIPCLVFLFGIATKDYSPERIGDMLIVSLVSVIAAFMAARIQTRVLKFTGFRTNRDAPANYLAVMTAIRTTNWQITKEQEASIIIATVPGSMRSWGERVEVRFDDNHVYVNSICNPSRHVSMTAWGRNRENVEFIRHAVLN